VAGGSRLTALPFEERAQPLRPAILCSCPLEFQRSPPFLRPRPPEGVSAHWKFATAHLFCGAALSSAKRPQRLAHAPQRWARSPNRWALTGNQWAERENQGTRPEKRWGDRADGWGRCATRWGGAPQERAMPQNERADTENGWAWAEKDWAQPPQQRARTGPASPAAPSCASGCGVVLIVVTL
jgi:hypothetical protein